MEKLFQFYLVLLTTLILHGDSTRAVETLADASHLSEVFHLSRVGSTFLTYSWDGEALTKLLLTHVVVDAQPSSIFGTHRLVSTDATAEEATADGLDAYTLYNVIIEVTGEGGRFVFPMPPVQTWPTAPPPISPPTGKGTSTTQIEVEWKAPTRVKGVLQPYTVTCFEVVTNRNPTSASTDDNMTTSLTISDLRINTGYVCVVTASTYPAEDQALEECTRKSDPSSPIYTMGAAMRRPTFEAAYYEDIDIMDLVIHDPKGVNGTFGGFEVFLATGGTGPQGPWRSVVNLTAEERKCELEGIEPSSKYSVTVRGYVLPHNFSEYATPLVFETKDEGRSLPQSIQLEAADPYTMRLTWKPPKEPYGRIAGYPMEWTLDYQDWENTDLPPNYLYDFTDLKPGQTVVVNLRVHTRPMTPVKFDYFGTRSTFVKATIPSHKQGMRKPTFEAIFFGDSRDLHIKIHDPQGVIGTFAGYELLYKLGLPTSETPWTSVVNLTAKERDCDIANMLYLHMYSVTVRGIISPDTFSLPADPLTFTVVHEDLSAPQRVELVALDSSSAELTWQRPKKPYGFITGYGIKWTLDGMWQTNVNLTSGNSHTFPNLKSGQVVTAAVCAYIEVPASQVFEYITPFCEFQTVTIPSPEKH